MAHQRTRNYYGQQEVFCFFFFSLPLKASPRKIAPGNLGPRRSAAEEDETHLRRRIEIEGTEGIEAARKALPSDSAAFCDMYMSL